MLVQPVPGLVQQEVWVCCRFGPHLGPDEAEIEREVDCEGDVEVGGRVMVRVVVPGTHRMRDSISPAALRRSTPPRAVPGDTVLNTVPNFFTLSCSSARRRSSSSVSTMIS